MGIGRKIKQRVSGLLFVLPLLCGFCTISAQENASKTEPKEIENCQLSEVEAAEKSKLHKEAMLSVGLPQMKGDDHLALERLFYYSSFNKKHNLVDWVMWALTPNMLVKKERVPFLPDPTLDYENRVEKNDYSNSGYSRGHMMPAAVCHFSAVADTESSYMSNICPQTAKLNTGTWNSLEQKCRNAWCRKEGMLYIVCGPVYKSEKPKKIGKTHEISVPDAYFKIVLSMKQGEEKMIGFMLENVDSTANLQSAVASVAEIEKATGITFFPGLPKELSAKLKSSSDFGQWHHHKGAYGKTERNMNRHREKKSFEQGSAGFKSNYTREHQKGGHHGGHHRSQGGKKQLWDSAKQ